MQRINYLLINFFSKFDTIYMKVRDQPRTKAWLPLKFFFFLLSCGYKLGLFVHKTYQYHFIKPIQVPSFVVSVGNIAVGGSGKTPFVKKLSKDLLKQKPAIIAKGYKSRSARLTFREVFPSDDPSDVGDEPLWFVRNCEGTGVFVGSSKSEVAQKISFEKHPILLIDDGLQHRKLHKDFSIVLLHSKMDWEKGYLPYGHLRDSPKALASADCIALHQVDSKEEFIEQSRKIQKYSSAEIIGTKLIFDVGASTQVKGKKIAVVTAIAFPKPFIDQLNEIAEVMAHLSLPDHNAISLEILLKWWDSLSFKEEIEAIVCTEKDATKWPNPHPLAVNLVIMEADMEILFGKQIYEKALEKIREGLDKKRNAVI